MVTVEVCYASKTKQFLQAIEVKEGTTIEQAIVQSGVLKIFPEIDLAKQSIGIFSRRAKRQQQVKTGDRIEIYRGLEVPPMMARRLRAKGGIGLNSGSV